MRRAWKAFWDDLASGLEHRAATMRTGVTIIEAVAADEFEVELLAITGSTQAASDAREVALDAAKCGLTPDQAREAFAQWVRQPYRLGYELELVKRYVQGRIDANG